MPSIITETNREKVSSAQCPIIWDSKSTSGRTRQMTDSTSIELLTLAASALYVWMVFFFSESG